MVRVFVDGVARFPHLRPGEDPRAAAESFCRQYGVTDGNNVKALEDMLRALTFPPLQPNPQRAPQQTLQEESPMRQQPRRLPPPHKSQLEAEKTLEDTASQRPPPREPPPRLPPQRSDHLSRPHVSQQEQQRLTEVAGGRMDAAAERGGGEGGEARGKGDGDAADIASVGKTVEEAAIALKGKPVSCEKNNRVCLVFLFCATSVHTAQDTYGGEQPRLSDCSRRQYFFQVLEITVHPPRLLEIPSLSFCLNVGLFFSCVCFLCRRRFLCCVCILFSVVCVKVT